MVLSASFQSVILLNFDRCTESALTRTELSKSELELDLNRLRSEASGLRDALLKLQALNNGLGQDKAELNAMITHVGYKCYSMLVALMCVIMLVEIYFCDNIR